MASRGPTASKSTVGIMAVSMIAMRGRLQKEAEDIQIIGYKDLLPDVNILPCVV
ncbi:hypothetical protein [Sphingobium lactosutens]|uniref:hypothetical protein n=1 Tax=Sphingobium lactosutens TaxID=522773 RepID=UPI0015BEDE6F|nr:hypothetical protein [Sphingobium lactosutens]